MSRFFFIPTLLRSIWFNTPQLAAVTGGVGDLFPPKGKDFKVKSLIPRSLLLGSSFSMIPVLDALCRIFFSSGVSV
jgi:hypothetical protein